MKKLLCFSLLSLFFIPPALIWGDSIRTSHEPGEYSKEIVLHLAAESEIGRLFYQFQLNKNQSPIPYSIPLELSALPGERKTYNISTYLMDGGEVLSQQDFSYTINNSYPAAPSVSYPSGDYDGEISVKFIKVSDSAEIVYSINEPIGASGTRWNGQPLLLQREQRKNKTYLLSAYSIDSAGHTSAVQTWTYTIHGKKIQSSDELTVYSPVPGDFANTQFLFIDTSGLEWIKYTVNGGDPRHSGTLYSGPVELDVTGPVRLRIAAKSLYSQTILKREIVYSVTPVSNIKTGLKSGIYNRSVHVSLDGDSEIYYTFGDKDPGKYGLLYREPFTVKPSENSMRTVTLRFHSYSKVTSRLNEHRYVLVLDTRVPEKPDIRVDEPNTARPNFRVSLHGPIDSSVRYTLDGSTPSGTSKEYAEPFYFDGNTPKMEIRARAFLSNGQSSREARRIILAGHGPPAVPDITVHPDPDKPDGYIINIKKEQDATLYYEVSYSGVSPDEPDIDSPRCPDSFTVHIPHGMDQQILLKIKAADRIGNLSPSREIALHLDRLPPPAPDMAFEQGKLILEGEGDLYYSLFTTGTTPRLPDSKSTRYREPAPLPATENQLELYTVYAVAYDTSGNSSDIAGPFNVEIDLRPPFVPKIKGIDNGSAVNLPQVALLFTDLPPSTDIYYSLSLDGRIPAIPDMRSPLFNESLLIKGDENRNTEVKLIFLPVQRYTGVHGDIQHFSFTIDRTIPKPPEIQFRNGILAFQGEGDIFFSISDSGDPGSDENEPLLYQTPVTLPGIDGEKTVYTVSALSIDLSGNISGVAGPQEIVVDRRIPALPPVIGASSGESYNTGVISLYVENPNPDLKVYYTYTLDGTAPPNPDTTSGFIDKSISFEGEPGKETLCTIKFMPHHTGSGRNGDVSKLYFTIDLKPPGPPSVKNLIPGGITNEPFFPIVLFDDETESLLIDISSSAENDLDPFGEGGTVFSSGLSLDVPRGDEQTFYFALGSTDRAGNRSEKSDTYMITVDKKLPSLPELGGIDHLALYNHRRTVTLTGAEPGGSLYYAISGAELDNLDRIRSRLQPYRGAIHLDANDGEEKTYYLYTAAEDSAANLIVSSDAVVCTIDKKQPDSPRVRGLPPSGTTREEVVIDLSSDSGVVYYTLSENVPYPNLPTPDSTQYTSPLTLEGVEGKETTYFISAVAVDGAMNVSRYPLISTVTIDRLSPVNLIEPKIDTSTLGYGHILVSSDHLADDLYFQIDGRGSFFKYTKPFEIPAESDREEITVSYFLQDSAGNKSNTKTVRVPLSGSSASFITGIENNRIYNDEVVIGTSSAAGVIRYALSAGTDEVPFVDKFSPQLKGSLTLAPLPGETVKYIMKAVLFEDKASSTGLQEQIVRFTLDRDPPPVPEIIGVGEAAYFKNDIEIEIRAADGTAYFQLLNTTAGNTDFNEELLKPYYQPVRVEAEKGEFASYTLGAFTVDEAGNRSRMVKASFYIDREIIYVATHGNDNFSGTRERPFKTIAKALEFASDTGRKTLFLNEGIHEINREISVSRDVTLVGGFETETWRREQIGKTVLVPGKGVPAGDSLFSIADGEFICSNIVLQDSKQNLKSFFHVFGGKLRLADTRIVMTGDIQETAIIQEGGLVSIVHSSINASGRGSRRGIVTTGGLLKIENSVLTGPSSHASDIILVSARGSEKITMSGCELNPGSGGTTSALAGSFTDIDIRDTIIHSGSATKDSVGIRLISGSLSMINSTIHGNAESRAGTLISAEDSSIEIEKSSFDCRSERGAIALSLKSSEIYFSRNILKGAASGEYLYLFKFSNSKGLVSNNQLFGGRSGDMVYAVTNRSAVKWYNNTFVSGAGKRQTRGFRVFEDEGSEMINNIFIPDSAENSIAFFISEESSLPVIRTNNFSGWRQILAYGSFSAATPDELNRADEKLEENSISGNISEQRRNTFLVTKDGELKLQQSSLCVNSGTDVGNSGGEAFDWEGEPRPNEKSGIVPAFDIGADEFYSLPQTRSGS